MKMQILRIVLGSMDNPRSNVDVWPYYQMRLNRYYVENDVKYPEDGSEMRFEQGY